MSQVKECPICKKPFEVFEPRDRWASDSPPKNYRHRKYCSNACKQESYRRRALDGNNIVTGFEKHQGGVMPHLEQWARKHNLI